MKEYLADIVRDAVTTAGAFNQVREYLQARILGALQRMGAMTVLAFHGGTALRFLYRIPRYSEDLDFTLEMDQGRYDFRNYLSAIDSMLTAEGYEVGLKVSDLKTVHSAFIEFSGLLFELGLSPHVTENLTIKLDVDTNPPDGATLDTTVVRRHITLHLQHHDRSSLLAGKLHALLQRGYLKGRDIFDLVWYLSDPDWPIPNLVLLNNALVQTGWEGGVVTAENWPGVIRDRLELVRWNGIVTDVRPFLAGESDTGLLTKEVALKLLDQREQRLG